MGRRQCATHEKIRCDSIKMLMCLSKQFKCENLLEKSKKMNEIKMKKRKKQTDDTDLKCIYCNFLCSTGLGAVIRCL